MSDKKPSLDRRISRPQTLAAAFGGLMRAFGARASDADLANRWDEIIGAELAGMVKLKGIRQKAKKEFDITVQPATPALALPLSYRTEELRKQINKYFGYNAVGKITVRK